jgi:hypothetical protein
MIVTSRTIYRLTCVLSNGRSLELEVDEWCDTLRRHYAQ